MAGLRTRRISTALLAVTMALALAACVAPAQRSSAPPRAGEKGPRIESISPASGPTSGGTAVTIEGDGFTDATEVSFDGVAAAFVVDSESQITATTPAHVEGSAPVVVTTPSGSSDDPIVFTYDPSADLYAEADDPVEEATTPSLTLSVTLRAYNAGPDTISQGTVSFSVDQSAAATGADTNYPTAVDVTSSTCTAVGAPNVAGTWGYRCEASMPPGSYITMTFRITYDTPPDSVGFIASIYDNVMADPDSSNNTASTYWPAGSAS